MNAEPLVLYAEDDENDAFFMTRAFEKLKRPRALRVVSNGRQAVDYLSGHGNFADRSRHPYPAMILLDVKMPEMSGLEALAWIRARREFDALPVVMFTSSMQDKDVNFSRTHGANAYLAKPSNADELHRLVHQLLQRVLGETTASPGVQLDGNLL